MVRNYKKKGVYKTFSKEVIEKAILEVEEKKMSLRSVAKNYGIPPSTLSGWANKKVRLCMLNAYL